MSAGGGQRSATADRVLAGMALGAVGGIFAISFGIPGLVGLALVALFMALIPPRFAVLAGLLTAVGAVWTFFTVLGVIRCALSPGTCSGPSPVPFLGAAIVVLGAGVLLLRWTWRRRSAGAVATRP